MTHFEWWDKVGSGMPPLDGEDAHEHVQRVTAACWDAARAAIYDAEAAQLTAPLRERLAHAEHWAKHSMLMRSTQNEELLRILRGERA